MGACLCTLPSHPVRLLASSGSSCSVRHACRHPDLAPNVDPLNPGWNAVDDNYDPIDTVGHGTGVAGVIGMAGNNLNDGTGVNWKVGGALKGAALREAVRSPTQRGDTSAQAACAEAASPARGQVLTCTSLQGGGCSCR